MTSQSPLDKWHHIISYPTLADAILFGTQRIQDLSEKESGRKSKSNLIGPAGFE